MYMPTRKTIPNLCHLIFTSCWLSATMWFRLFSLSISLALLFCLPQSFCLRSHSRYLFLYCIIFCKRQRRKKKWEFGMRKKTPFVFFCSMPQEILHSEPDFRTSVTNLLLIICRCANFKRAWCREIYYINDFRSFPITLALAMIGIWWMIWLSDRNSHHPEGISSATHSNQFR